MELMQLMQERRSIRKYQDKQIPQEDLQKILEAGAYAPNAGGGQRSLLVGIQDSVLCRRLGQLNVGSMDRSKLLGSYVSKDQPSIIDDPTIKSGFYGAPSVCVVFGPKNFLYSIPDAFCCAENMVLMAQSLGISSCIVARGEETFQTPLGQELMAQWNIPETYTARCFVLLGYCQGTYPGVKPRKTGRTLLIPAPKENGGN
jgi:nitroreductase